MRGFLVLAGGAVLTVSAALLPGPGSTRDPTVGGAVDPGGCVACHRERHPGLVAQHEASGHAQRGIGCAACHGDDHAVMFSRAGRVPTSVCRECHARETAEFEASAHYRSRGDALAYSRGLENAPALRRRGCLGCHDDGAPGPDETHEDDVARCNACHGAHRYSAADARRAETCGMCHRGPDHPQLEAWEASLHGTVYASTHDEEQAPTCVTCHMPGKTHAMGVGLTFGADGNGAVLEGTTPPIAMHTISAARAKAGRESMLAVCMRCHGRRKAEQSLADADAIKEEADRIVAEGARIVTGLHRDGLLDPMPEARRAHPTAGHALVLGELVLYETESDAERIFFDLARFAHTITYKSAYHQSPDFTHWYGVTRLKADLVELKAEERRLRERAPPPDPEGAR